MTVEIKYPPVLVALDTEVFSRFNYNYNSKPCQSLIELVQEEKIKLVLTTVNLQEIKGHIKEKSQSVLSSINKFLKDIGVSDFKQSEDIKSLITTDNSLLNKFKEKVKEIAPTLEEIYQELLNQLEVFLNEAKFEIIDIDCVSVNKVFENYFSCTSPFDTGKKKSEFPDAFALLALQKEAQDKIIYVVSGDTDWEKFCNLNENKNLLYFENVNKLLDKINKDNSNDLEEFNKCYELFGEKEDEIKEDIKNQLPDLKFSIDINEESIKWDVEKVEVFVSPVDIFDSSLIHIQDFNDDGVNEVLATFELIVVLDYHAHVTFTSLNSKLYDSEERRYGVSKKSLVVLPQLHYLDVELTLGMSRDKDNNLCNPFIKLIHLYPNSSSGNEIVLDTSLADEWGYL